MGGIKNMASGVRRQAKGNVRAKRYNGVTSCGVKASRRQGVRHPVTWKAKTVITLPRELGKQLTHIVRVTGRLFLFVVSLVFNI
jgi:hypothetical protein